MRDVMTRRSEMADALVKVLDLWRAGVLIMDEVDVLLHPLRSELNFPIGAKFPIDLAPFRWDFPMFLFDALYFKTTGRVTSSSVLLEVSPEGKGDGTGGVDVKLLEEISVCIQQGYATHAFQRNPHLVLLDEEYYHTALKPLLARWALGWLHAQFVGKVSVSDAVLLTYICGDNAHLIEQCREAVEEGLVPESKKLLNLAADWMRRLMPHVLSKINRVS